MLISLFLLGFGCIVMIAAFGIERNKNFFLRKNIKDLEWRNRWLESQIYRRHKINMTLVWNDSSTIMPEAGRWIIVPRVNPPKRYFPYDYFLYKHSKMIYHSVRAGKKWAYLDPVIEAIKKTEGTEDK